MKITLIQIGKTDLDYIKSGILEYQKRLEHYVKFEIKELKNLKNLKNLSILQQKQKESEYIFENIDPKTQIFLLDENGKEHNSPQFAGWLEKKLNIGGDITFVIGGAYGFSEEIKKKYQSIALSRMTFSHQMIRLFFVEQLYRAFTIIKRENYHH